MSFYLSQHQEDHGFTGGRIGPLVRDVRPEGPFEWHCGLAGGAP